MGYEFRNNTDPLTVIKQLRATSEKQSKHLAQALKEKNDHLRAANQWHEWELNAEKREDLWRDRTFASQQRREDLQKRYDALAQTVADGHAFQLPAPIVIESKELFERNQYLQKRYDELLKHTGDFWGRGLADQPKPKFRVGQLVMALDHNPEWNSGNGAGKPYRIDKAVVRVTRVTPVVQPSFSASKFRYDSHDGKSAPELWFRALRPEEIS